MELAKTNTIQLFISVMMSVSIFPSLAKENVSINIGL
jgi:hypothetical protein